MPDQRAPKNGDFAAYLEGRVKAPQSAVPSPAKPAEPTAQDLLEQEADRLEAEELAQELANPPDPGSWEITDEELERQALSAPGEDGDASTPE